MECRIVKAEFEANTARGVYLKAAEQTEKVRSRQFSQDRH